MVTGPQERIVDTSGAQPGPDAGDPGGPRRVRDRLRTMYRVIQANPTGRVALKIGVAVVGAIVVAIGLALVPLPGPGWALVILGLSIWAIEFAWARHLLGFTKRQVLRWVHWIGRQSWPVRILVGLLTVAFVGVVVWLSVRASFGVDLVDKARDLLATR